jgi:hypothetical protein
MAFRQSHREDLIQVVDLLGGAIYRRVTANDEMYSRLIQSKTLLWAYHAPATINPLT